jgi:steroid delta-isomerase-like uncharacterized protein
MVHPAALVTTIEESAMSNVQLHQAAHRAMSEEGAAEAAAYFAEDVTYTDYARNLIMKGSDEATEWLGAWKSAFSDARVGTAAYLDAGEWTVARFRAIGTNDGPFAGFPATGRQLDAPFCELLRWRDGQAVEGEIYYDAATIMTQLGHMPPMTP